MRPLTASFLLLLGSALAGPAAAVETEYFIVDSAGDLALLCGAAADDPLQREALHFCHGFVVGAYHYHVKSTGRAGRLGFRLCPGSGTEP